jgi:Domain of unknown function (DUF1992)
MFHAGNDMVEAVDRWYSIADEKIREAIEAGKFRRLSGHGKPLDLRRNPYEPEELRMAHLVLEGAGLSPAWIAERKDLDRDIDAARTALRLGFSSGEGDTAASEFRAAAIELNKRILTYNIRVPSGGFQRAQIDIEFEISCQGETSE